MNLKQLSSRRYALMEEVEEAIHDLGNLIETHDTIMAWFEANALRPIRFDAKPSFGNPALALVFTFPNEQLVPFAAKELDFWHFAKNLMPLDEDLLDRIAGDGLVPFVSAEFRDDEWDLVVTPDLESGGSGFPGAWFWNREAQHEEFVRECMAEGLKRERVRHVMSELARSW